MTYKQAYDKIIDAYFKDEIRPFEWQFCFCGNLCDKTQDWDFIERGEMYNGYFGFEFKKMEAALIDTMTVLATGRSWTTEWNNEISDALLLHDNYEDFLFEGLVAALDVLKQIHIDRGEEIDSLPTFIKRVFSDVLKMVK